MLKRWMLVICLCLLPAAALAGETAWVQVPELLRPGKLMQLAYTAPEGESATISVVDGAGKTALNLVSASSGRFTWDGAGVEPGEYVLRLRCGDQTAERAVTVGDPAPVIEVVDSPAIAVSGWTVRVHCSLPGRLTLTLDDGRELAETEAVAGDNVLVWNGMVNNRYLPDGQREAVFRLTDETGFSSTACVVSVLIDNPSLAHDVSAHSPDSVSGITCDHDVCYWKLNMGEMDESLVWEVLTQPVTVLEGNERNQEKVRREPREDCKDYTGEVTYASQAVHVLEKGEEWTLIEAYSSSVEGSPVKNFAGQFTGYVKTSLLKEKTVSQHIGVVIDKLQQRLYVYRDGSLFSTLLCSTGFPRADTPYNETPAGEYLAIRWTGGFWSDKLYCDMAIRFNDGDLLHEVPCLIDYDEAGREISRDYDRCGRFLGEKASHGCIRVQREKSPEGVNMKWLWDNLPRNSDEPAKILIWDELTRQLAPADDQLTVYYNPDNGRQYHSSAYCALVNDRFLPLTAFTCGELESAPYSKLKRCPGCTPPLRRSEVDGVNEKNHR